jgi:hypothetical protein
VHVASYDPERGHTLLAHIDAWQPALDRVAADLDAILGNRVTITEARTRTKV